MRYRDILSYNQTYSELCAVLTINSAILRTQAHLEPETSLKACRTCKMIRHVQSPGIARREGDGGGFPALFENKKVSIFGFKI